MNICGTEKLTLLDFPGKLACTVFLGGCNFRCPFCHNGGLVLSSEHSQIDTEDFFSFLKKRQGILEGVCISGGEPLLCDDLIDFAEKIHSMGFAVKLDTNGYLFERLKTFAESGFCDYIAADIKNTPAKYAQTVGLTAMDTSKILRSIEYIKNSDIPHEFRTTVVREMHTADDIREISRLIAGENNFFIQPFRDSDGVIRKGLHGFSDTELDVLLNAAREHVPRAVLRGWAYQKRNKQ